MTTATEWGKSHLKHSAASLLLASPHGQYPAWETRTTPDWCWGAPHSLKAASATYEGWDPGQACGVGTLASTSRCQRGSEKGSTYPGTRGQWELHGKCCHSGFSLRISTFKGSVKDSKSRECLSTHLGNSSVCERSVFHTSQSHQQSCPVARDRCLCGLEQSV